MKFAERMGISSIIAFVAFIITNAVAFFYALVNDIVANEVLWVVADIVFAPVGVIRGWLMWFGVI